MSEEMLQTESMADYEDQFDNANPWNIVTRYMNEGENLTVKIEGIVSGGAIVYLEGLRGFIPASRLSLSYVDNIESYLLQEIEVRVIDVSQAENKLVLSAREILKEKEKQEMARKISQLEVGGIMEGVVESLQNYGAFVRLANGLSGLVHISQISDKRVKSPSDVLTVGDNITVKIIGVKDGKISLSIKALIEPEEEIVEKVEIPESEEVGTSLGELFKKLQL